MERTSIGPVFRVSQKNWRREVLASPPLANKKRLCLMLDYDGTLVPIARKPEGAVLDREMRARLEKLIRLGVKIVVVSGRPSEFLEDQLGSLELTMAAEHGARVRLPGETSWQNRVIHDKSLWYEIADRIMSGYAKRVRNSFVEKKVFALAWHYRLSPEEDGGNMAEKLKQDLERAFAGAPVSVLSGKKVIEVRAMEADKGIFAKGFMDSRLEPDTLVVALGDDATDEDLFSAVGGRGVSFRVGVGPTAADFILAHQTDVKRFFDMLISWLEGH